MRKLLKGLEKGSSVVNFCVKITLPYTKDSKGAKIQGGTLSFPRLGMYVAQPRLKTGEMNKHQ
jgi:hypothetical protein